MDDIDIVNPPAPTADPRRPYEKPTATFVELKPEERLMKCGFLPPGQGSPGCAGSNPNRS